MDSRRWTPSPALVVSILALVVAIGGTAIAGSGALSKKEKKQTRNIAARQIERLAPGLAVASAAKAGSADTAGSAGNASNADALAGSSLAEVAPGASAFDATCTLTFTTADCVTVSLQLDRPADVVVVALGQWYSTNAGTAAQGQCLLDREGSTGTAAIPFGTLSDDTDTNNTRTIGITEEFSVPSAGTATFRLRCDEVTPEVVVEQVRISAFVTT